MNSAARILKRLWRAVYDPYAFRRVDYPGFTDAELPKRLVDVDRKSPEVRARIKRSKAMKSRSREVLRNQANTR